MKFGRLLRTTAEDLPEMNTLFQTYKRLKKQLKRLPVKEEISRDDDLAILSEQETDFVTALSASLHNLNDVFLEREETNIIKVERLAAEAAEASTVDSCRTVYKAFIDFHGEMLLLVHWSVLAYTATVKILKKHHKRTGLLLKAPHLGNLLSQPFCSTEVMTSLVRQAEEHIQRLSEKVGTLPAHFCSEEEDCAASGQRRSKAGEQLDSGKLTILQHITDDLHFETASVDSVSSDNLEDCDDSDDSKFSQHTGEGEPQTSSVSSVCGDHNTKNGASDVASNLIRRTQVALTTWEELKRTASTPSTVLEVCPPSKKAKTGVNSLPAQS